MTDFPKKPAIKFGKSGKRPFSSASKPSHKGGAQQKKNYSEMKKAKADFKSGNDNYTPPLDHHSAYLIYGRHPAVLALQNPKRVIKKIVCSQNGLNFLEEKLEAEQLTAVAVKVVDVKRLDSMLPPDSNHQGIILVAEALEQPELEQVIESESKLVVVLDQITDPHNIGAIIRSAAAFGAGGVITSERASPAENATIIKTAAGTFENMPYVRGGNLNDTILKLKKAGYYAIGLDGDAEVNIRQVSAKAGKYAIVVGAEGKGLRQLVKENCDVVAKIDISGEVESLNASVAAAVALYAVSALVS